MKRKIVRVNWLDSYSWRGGWQTLEEALKECSNNDYSQVTVGILLNETPTQIVLCHGLDLQSKPAVIGTNVIPVGCIKSVEVLGEVDNPTEVENGQS